MISALRFCLSLLVATIYYGFILAAAGLTRVRYRPGGVYDSVPRSYGRFLLRVNRIPVTVVHPERLSEVHPCVYVANHQSWIDPLALVDVLPGSVRFTPKKELMYVPILGVALRAGKHIAIDRGDHDSAMAAYQKAAALIREGISAIIFPEGTRSRDGQLLEFKKGPFVLAIAAQVPVVPIWLEGTREVLPRGSMSPQPRPVIVRVGLPIPTTGLTYEDRDTLLSQCREGMMGLQLSLRSPNSNPGSDVHDH